MIIAQSADLVAYETGDGAVMVAWRYAGEVAEALEVRCADAAARARLCAVIETGGDLASVARYVSATPSLTREAIAC